MAKDWFRLDPRIGVKVSHPLVEAVWVDGLDQPPRITIGGTVVVEPPK